MEYREGLRDLAAFNSSFLLLTSSFSSFPSPFGVMEFEPNTHLDHPDLPGVSVPFRGNGI